LSSMGNLLRNENMKIYRRPRTWLMIGFLLVVLGLMSGSTKVDQANWKANITQENVHLQKMVSENKLDADTKKSFEDSIKINDYYLENDINPRELTLWDYVNNSSMLIMLVTILTVVVAADMIAAEFTWGTIKLLLVGPASRLKIMVSKYAATLFLAGGFLEGFGSVSSPLLTVGSDGLVHEGSMVVHSLEKYGYSIVSLLMYVTFAFMISAAFRSSSMAIAFSLLFMLAGNMVTMILSGYEWSKYLLFANIDLTQYLPGSTPIRPEMTLGFSIGMLVAYYVVFQLVSWLLFTRRDVAA